MHEVIPATLVFVHLGPGESPLLESLARQAQLRLEGSSAVLVTDCPRNWSGFPGEVVVYERSRQDQWLDRLERRNPEKSLDSGGFWIRTLERIFALERAADLEDRGPLVHLEGDVMSLLTPPILRALMSHCTRVAVPMISTELACPSLVFIPSRAALREALDELRALAGGYSRWFTDMQLLGSATREGVLQELPTVPERALVISGDADSDVLRERVIFDAAAIGQFLYGVDPVHTRGVRIPGFVSPSFPVDIRNWSWSIDNGGCGQPTLRASTPDGTVIIANLHLHAKYDPGPPTSPPSEAWRVALDEANGTRLRCEYPSSVSPDRFYAAPPWARLISWRHDGWPRIRDSVRYRLRLSKKRSQ